MKVNTTVARGLKEMKNLDIIKKLDKIDKLEKENGLNDKDFHSLETELGELQQKSDILGVDYENSRKQLLKKGFLNPISYVFGSSAVVFLILYLCSSVNKNHSRFLSIGFAIGFCVLFIAYLIISGSIKKSINAYKKSERDFNVCQEQLILKYIEALVYGYKLDLKMYREIYQKIFDVQEYLREHDKKGFKSFEKAFEALNIDLSKYTEKTKKRWTNLDIQPLN